MRSLPLSSRVAPSWGLSGDTIALCESGKNKTFDVSCFMRMKDTSHSNFPNLFINVSFSRYVELKEGSYRIIILMPVISKRCDKLEIAKYHADMRSVCGFHGHISFNSSSLSFYNPSLGPRLCVSAAFLSD